MKTIILILAGLSLFVLARAEEPKLPPCDPVKISICVGSNMVVIRAWVNQAMCCGTKTLYLERNSCCGWNRLRTNALAICTEPTIAFTDDQLLPYAIYRVVQK